VRILHTADWHVGRNLARKPRLEETKAVLEEVLQIARDESVDAVIVAGDVYEHQAPSAEAEQIVFDTLLGFERERIPVVVVAGNHDHPGRWRALMPLLQRLSIHVVSHPVRPRDGGIVELTARDGGRLQVACLPWVPERKLTGSAELMGLQGEVFQTYAEGVAGLLRGLCKDLDPRACTVLAAHLFSSGAVVASADGDRSERSLTIGELYAVAPQALPMVQYAALGHVHRPQEVPMASIPSRYAGSLMALDFGEVGQDKSVAIIDLEPGMPAQVRTIPITRGRRLLHLDGTMEELEALTDSVGNAFLRVNLRCAGPEVGLGNRIRELLPNALVVRLDYPRMEEERAGGTLRHLAPREQFARYFQGKHGTTADSAYLDLFETMIRESGLERDLDEPEELVGAVTGDETTDDQ
jgi:exonuclease SbcD